MAKLSPETALPRDRTRFITEEKAQVTFTAGKELLKKIERLKVLTFHQNPEGSLEKTLEKALDVALDKLDPERREKRRIERKTQKTQEPPTPKCRATLKSQTLRDIKKTNMPHQNPTMGAMGSPQSGGGRSTQLKNPPPKPNSLSCSTLPKQSKLTPAPERDQVFPFSLTHLSKKEENRIKRNIPAKIRDRVWVRDKGKCQFRDKRTGRVCHSHYRVEIDHDFPFSLGGGHDLNNLRLYCQKHNQFRIQGL